MHVQTYPWLVPIGTKSCQNIVFGPFPLNVFTTIKKIPHVYPLHALIYGLKLILE
jgi:hypothetical protein